MSSTATTRAIVPANVRISARDMVHGTRERETKDTDVFIQCACGNQYRLGARNQHYTSNRHLRFIYKTSSQIKANKSLKSITFESTTDTCSICIESMNGVATTLTSCSHHFCTQCFLSYTSRRISTHRKISCPLCRVDILAVACQIAKYDPYTTRIIRERNTHRNELKLLEKAYEWHSVEITRLETELNKETETQTETEIKRLDLVQLYEAEQSIIRNMSKTNHRLYQLESQLQIMDVVICSYSTEMLWLDWSTNAERRYTNECVKKLANRITDTCI